MTEMSSTVDDGMLLYGSRLQRARKLGFAIVRDAIADWFTNEIRCSQKLTVSQAEFAMQAITTLRSFPDIDYARSEIFRREKIDRENMDQATGTDPMLYWNHYEGTVILLNAYRVLCAGFGSTQGVKLKTILLFVDIINAIPETDEQ